MYEIRQLTNHHELVSFLAPRYDSSMFLLGNAESAGLNDQNKRIQGTYLGAYRDGELCGVLAHYWNGNLILQAPQGLSALLDALPQFTYGADHGRPRPIQGILGTLAQSEAALAHLKLTPQDLRLYSRERLFSLDLHQLKHAPVPPSSLIRSFTQDELELFTRWKVAYTMEALDQPDSEQLWAESRELAQIQIDEQSFYVLEHAGQPVSCSTFNTRTQTMVQIGGVWTPPEHRCQGFARCVVAASLNTAREHGVTRAILFTGHNNQSAIKAYRALGFQEVGDYAIFLFKSSYPLPQS